MKDLPTQRKTTRCHALFLLTIALVLTSTSWSFAQNITNYAFAATSGTFTTLTGATSPGLTAGGADDGYINNIPMGFDFFYMGEYYTTVSASTNGWLTLGFPITDSESNNNLNTGGIQRPVIAPLWDDLDVILGTNISYITTGTAPNRVFTIQYLNTKWQAGVLAGPAVEFQVKLTETTGRITFVYRRVTLGLVNNPSASVGISGFTAGSFLSLNTIFDNTATVSSSVETNTINFRPLNAGQTFTFTPPTLPAPSGLNFSLVTSNSMRLNWTDNSSNETKFVIYRSTDNVTFTYYTSVAANTTLLNTSTVSTLNALTTYYWRVYTLSEGGLSNALSGSRATLCGGPNTTQVATSGLIGRYKLDGNAGDDANVNPGSFQNGPTPTTDRFGIANRAYLFNGVNQFMATTNLYVNPPDYSIAVWFKTSTTVGGRLIGFGDSRVGTSANHDRMIWMDDDGKINFCVNPGGVGTVISSPLNYNDDTWHQVIATSATGTGIKLYIDGIQVASNTASGGQAYAGYWKLAWESGGWNPPSTSLFIHAALDDFLIYNRAITPAEVTSSFNNPDGAGSNSPVCNGGTLNLTAPTVASATYTWTGPNSFSSALQNPTVSNMSAVKEGTYTLTITVAGCAIGTTSYAVAKINPNLGPAISQVPTTGLLSRYKLDANAKDEQGINPGVLNGSPIAAADRFTNTDKAMSFNGINQFMSTTRNYPSPGPTTYTIALWFKTTTNTGGRLVGFGDSKNGTSGSRDRHIYMNNAGKILVGTGGLQYTSTLSYNDNLWHHIVVTASTTAGVGTNVYIDGTNVYAAPAATATGAAYGGYWRIGYDNLADWTTPPASNYFNGTIDDVLIYNTALTAAQALILYRSPDGASNNTPVCVGSTFTLSATTVGSTTYAWSGPGGYSASVQNPTPTFISAYSGEVFTLSASSAGCTSNAYTIAVPNTTTPGNWVGYANTSWQNNDNWCGGVQPSSTTNVTISSVANLPVNTGGALANNITINSPATLTNTGAGTLSIYGNWVNTGTFTDNGTYLSGGYVNFTGSVAQNISGAGTNTFSNLTLTNSNGLILNAASTARVNGILTLTTGVFTTNNNLTQNLYTGAIAGTGSGSTTGNINFTKTIWGDRYHYISSPITGRTALDWNDDVTIKFGANSNLFSYNEASLDTNKKVGWTAVTSTGSSLADVKGYALFFPRWVYTTTLDIVGPYIHNASFTSPTLTNTPSTTPVAKPSSDGWHLVGNPYPSTIDWDASTGWTKPALLGNAIYMYDNRLKRYAYYAAGVNVNGGSRYIGSMQGFFVKMAAGGSGTLGLNNDVRVTSILHDVWRTVENNLLRISINSEGYSDETVICFREEASETFDNEWDAYKLANEDSIPSLSSVSAQEEYAINSLSTSLVNKTIPLQLDVAFNGTYTLSSTTSGFENEESFYLEDRALEIIQNLSDDPTYTVTLPKGSYPGRFFIHYAKENIVMNTNTAAKNSGITIGAAQHSIFLLFAENNTGSANVAVFDALGKEVYARENVAITGGKIELNLPYANSGIYIIKVQTSTSSKTQQVYIQK